MIQRTQLIYLLLFLAACGAPKPKGSAPIAANTLDCTTRVMAKDFTGLDGCRILLVTEDQKKFLIAENLEGVTIEAGKAYTIGYEVVEGFTSACMAEDAMILLKCVEELKRKRPELRDCFVEDDAFKIPFLKTIIEAKQPLRIIRHEFRGAAAYRINFENSTMLYDCQGNDMCEDLGKPFAPCLNFFKTDFGAAKIIYQGEGPRD